MTTKEELIIELKNENKVLARKNKELNDELERIIASKVWKALYIYKQSGKMIKNLKTWSGKIARGGKNMSPIKFIDGNFVENKVLGVCHPEWHGVRNATIEQCAEVALIDDGHNKRAGEILIDFIRHHDYKKIAFNAIIDGQEILIKKLAKEIPDLEIYFIWHGSFTQQTIEDHIMRFDGLENVFDKIKKFGFVKKNMEIPFQQMGLRAEYLPNRISLVPQKNKNKKIKSEELKVGIPSTFLWHKNNLNQAIGARLAGANEIKVLDFPRIFYLDDFFEGRVKKNKFQDHTNFLKLLQTVDINLYISLTECYPMVFLESIFLGIPCLVGKTSSFVLDDAPFLQKHLVVEAPENYLEIRDKINFVVENYAQVSEEIWKFANKIAEKNKVDILNFFVD